MPPEIDPTDHTVDELIHLWQVGNLGVDDGEVHDLDQESIEVVYEGQDAKLFIHYSLADSLTTRSDEEGHFDIMDAEPEVDGHAAD